MTSLHPLDDLRGALVGSDGGAATSDNGATVRLDANRSARTGIPEVVLAASKRDAEVVEALTMLADANGRALASRCRDDTIDAVSAALGDQYQVNVDAMARALVVAIPGRVPQPTGGRVAVVAAGTSDLPLAAEAALMAREMGTTVREVVDVGVAGLHRLIGPLDAMLREGVDAVVVAAGMDGALPSVVAGLVPVPVIGLPTSVGYGFGGAGVGALTTMLQSCAPGLVVVNIDNGIGAGAAAARIANLAAAGRRQPVR